jgi:DNA-binding transcriptional LysR family regulator
MAEDILPVACATLFRAAPNVTLKVVVANNDVLMPALRRGELDVTASGIPTSPYEDLVQEYLYEDEFVVVTSADHLLARKKVVTITDLTGERWVLAPANVLSGQWLRRAFSDRGLPAPRVAMEASATRLRMHMVSSCGFLDFAARSTLSQAMQHYRLVELPVKELAWRRSVGVSYRKDAYLSPTAHRFVDILKATAKKTNVAKNR